MVRLCNLQDKLILMFTISHLVTSSLRLFNRFFVEKMMWYFYVRHNMPFFEAGEEGFALSKMLQSRSTLILED